MRAKASRPRSKRCASGRSPIPARPSCKRDIDNFKAALKGVKVEEAFLPVAAPASVIPDRKNEYYKSEEELIRAIGAAMRTEYRMIIDAGFVLQLDDARAAVTYDRMVPPASFADYRKWLALAGRRAQRGDRRPAGGPHPLSRLLGQLARARTPPTCRSKTSSISSSAEGRRLVIEGANPRHEHEWRVWESAKLPPGKVLIPGVISHATNVVEHPELVAERIVRLAKLVGRENVIAGTDCGFAQGPFHRRVHPSIMWAKLDALVKGAKLASAELWA